MKPLLLVFGCLIPPSLSQSGCNEGEKPKTCQNGEAVAKWYWNKTWFRCMSTVSSCDAPGLFSTVEECNQRCRPFDGPSCTGPRGSSAGTGLEGQCLGDETCPAGHRCVGGAFFSSCCPADQLDAVEAAFADTCPNGDPAFPSTDLIGLECSDLACPQGFQCRQINSFFARCCQVSQAPIPKKPQIPFPQADFSTDRTSEAGGQKTLQVVDKASRLAAMRIMAPVRGDCFDKHPFCPGWAAQFQGTTVWWQIEGRWQQFTLPQDHCDWNPFLKTMEGCPLSCGVCKPRQIRFRFIPQTSTLIWV